MPLYQYTLGGIDAGKSRDYHAARHARISFPQIIPVPLNQVGSSALLETIRSHKKWEVPIYLLPCF